MNRTLRQRRGERGEELWRTAKSAKKNAKAINRDLIFPGALRGLGGSLSG